jgi:YegS/Rv2252/BmrU family lipid kinase
VPDTAASETRASICLLVNPSAGGGRAARLAPQAERLLRDRGLSVRRVDTRDLEHARELAVQAARAGETVVVLSGDGAVGAVAESIRSIPGAVLGVLPGGRGNDLARALGISQEIEQACATIAEGEARAMDVGEVCETAQAPDDPAAHVPAQRQQAPRTFVGIASAGFDSDANRIANEAPSWLGNLVYAYGALRALLSWRPARFEIELDPPGERHSFLAYTVGACNSRSYGGGMRAAPDALLDDGLLEVVVLANVGKLAFLTKILPRVFSGTHVNEPHVHVFRAREVSIEADRPFTMYADGDPIGELPLRVRAVPGAVNVLVPRGANVDFAFSDASGLVGLGASTASAAGNAPLTGEAPDAG